MATEVDRAALFGEVAASHHGLISRIALSHESDPALRHELVQEILLAIWVALDSFRADASLKTFVAAIARKRSISHVTRRAREPRREMLSLDLPSPAPSPDELAMNGDEKLLLAESMQRLPAPQRDAIALAFEGFSYAEVGGVLGISANAAMLRCQRAKASLRAMVGARQG
jgi:RNA polymerase sigma factor (sigma-70 family)